MTGSPQTFDDPWTFTPILAHVRRMLAWMSWIDMGWDSMVEELVKSLGFVL